MQYHYDEDAKCIFAKPNCTEEWLRAIYEYGCDYDGEHSVDGLKALVDELIDCAHEARKCLQEGNIYYDAKVDEKSYLAAREERKRHCLRKRGRCPTCGKNVVSFTDGDYMYCDSCHCQIPLAVHEPIFGYCQHCNFTFLYQDPTRPLVCPICGSPATEESQKKI